MVVNMGEAMTLRQTNKEVAEKILGSKGSVRILQDLAENGMLNHSQMLIRVGMNHGDVNRHLDVLKDFGMISERRNGMSEYLMLPDELTFDSRDKTG